MARQVNVVFSADTGKFVASVDGASKSVARSAQAVAQAKNEITAAFKLQIAAAKEAGASQEELAAITRRAAQMRSQVEEEAQQKLEASYNTYLTRRFATSQAAAARDLNLYRTQAEEQVRIVQQAALRTDIQTRKPEQTPLQSSKSAIAASYLEERAAAVAAGASEEELAALTKQYAQQRAEAVEQAEAEIVAARRASLAKQYGDEMAAAEQSSIRDRLESSQPAQQGGFWSRLFGSPAEAQGTVSSAEKVSQAVKSVGDAGDYTVSKGVKMRGALIAMKGGFENNTRAAATFAAGLPALSGLLEMAFPALGAAALIGILYQGVDALVKWKQESDELASRLAQGFESINAPLMENVDGLRKANDELEISIAHLEHKPANTLALALDEARINADRLASSARSAATSVEKLLKDNKSGFLANLFLDKGDTGDLSKEVSRRMSDIATQQRENAEAVRSGTDTPEAADARQKKLDASTAAFQQYIRETRATINGNETVYDTNAKTGLSTTTLKKYSDVHGDQTADNNILNGTEDYLDNLQDDSTQRARNSSDQVKQKQLEDAKKLSQEQQEAARKAAEAQRKADEAQKKSWQLEDDARKAGGNDSTIIELNVWTQRLASLKSGSEQYINAQHEVAERLTEARAKDAEDQRKAAADALKQQRDQWETSYDDWSTSAHRTPGQVVDFRAGQALQAMLGNEVEAQNRLTEAFKEQAKAAEEAAQARAKAATESQRDATAYSEAALAIERQTGRISSYDAALELAQIHSQQYAEELAQLQNEFAKQMQLDPGSAATTNAKEAVDHAESQRSIQIIQDQANIAANTIAGALTSAVDTWTQHATDSAAQVRSLFTQGIDGVNNNLVNAMSGDKTNWKSTGHDFFKSTSRNLLEHGEGTLFKGLGFGKPDGSTSNPYAVKVIGGSMGSAGDSLGKLFSSSQPQSAAAFSNSLFPEMQMPKAVLANGVPGGDVVGGVTTDTQIPASTGAQVAGGVIGTLGSMASLIFGGHRALGGGVTAGVAYDVGEMGRETFVPDTSGTIIPHSALGGGGTNYTVQVANGVTPEQMNMHVRAALAEYHPHVVRASVQAMQEHKARNPSVIR